MALLQIDTINVVARSPIWCCLAVSVRTRRRLDEALRRGELMEYWAHEACFLPRRDFKLIRHRMLSPEKMGWKYRAAWMHEHAEEIEQLVRHIQEQGQCVLPILNMRRKASAAGGNGNHINATLRVYLPPEKSWLLSGVIFNVYMI